MTPILKVPACRINDTASCQLWEASGTSKAGGMSSHHWFLEPIQVFMPPSGCHWKLHQFVTWENPWFEMAPRATK